MKIFFSGLFFFPLAWGLYVLGYYLHKAVEIYKGVAISQPPIPISTAFFVISAVVIFFAEIFLLFIYNKISEEY